MSSLYQILDISRITTNYGYYTPVGQDVLDRLGFAKLLLTNAKEAVKAFISNELEAFDPIVGENGCQIRAYNVIKGTKDQKLLDEAKALLKSLPNVLKRLEKFKNQRLVWRL